MDRRRLSFEATPKHGEVSGIVEVPAGARAFFLLGHGAGAGMEHRWMEAMAAALNARDVATLRYQFPYIEAGKRRPDPKKTLLTTIRSAAAVAQREAGDLPLIAGGKSMGGRMTSLAAAQQPLPGVRGLAFLGFPLHPPGKPGSERGEHLGEVGLPMLFIQGTRDKLADLELLRPVVDNLSDSATMLVIEGGDHSLAVPKRSGRSQGEVITQVAGAIFEFAMAISP